MESETVLSIEDLHRRDNLICPLCGELLEIAGASGWYIFVNNDGVSETAQICKPCDEDPPWGTMKIAEEGQL